MSTPIATTNHRRRTLPAPVFVLGYGLLLILAVVLIVLLVSHEARSEFTPPPKDKIQTLGAGFETDPQQTLSLVRPELIDDATASSTASGVRIAGVLTETAEADPAVLAVHIDQLLMSTCLPNLAVETHDNMQLDLWGFCFSSMPPAQLEELITDALDTKADSLTILDFPGNNHDKQVFYTWFTDTASEQAAVEQQWDIIDGHKEIELVSLSLYGPESVQVVDIEQGGTPRHKESPANEAFDRRWAR